MRSPLCFLILLFLLQLPVHAQQDLASRPSAIAFVNVTVVDVAVDDAGRALRPGQTVVVSGGRIQAVSPRASIPAGASIVESSGKYIIPGLWDMHVHSMYEGRPELFFPLLVANGVTGVREMASTFPLEQINHLRGEISAGRLLGPRFGAVTGKIVEGQIRAGQAQPEFEYIGTPEDARRLVRARKAQGADFIKVYNWLPRDVYFAIADEAQKQGLPLGGHTPIFLDAFEVSDAGQKSIEHLSGVLLASSSRESELFTGLRSSPSPTQAAHLEATVKATETFDERKAAALFSRFRENGTWQCPTLVLRRARAFISDPDIKDDPRLRYIPRSVRERWAKGPALADEDAFRTVYLKELHLAGAMHRAGVGILAGTDSGFGNVYTIPGFSLHDELGLLVRAGLTPLQALQAATINPAQFLGLRSSLGTVEPGKLADLVLLDANPLTNIGNTQTIAAVVVNGRYLPRESLQRMLVDVEVAANAR